MISLSSSISVADCSTCKALFYLVWEKVLTGTTNPQSSRARYTGVFGSKEDPACCQSVVASSRGVSGWCPRGFLCGKPLVCTMGAGFGLLEAAAAQGDSTLCPLFERMRGGPFWKTRSGRIGSRFPGHCLARRQLFSGGPVTCSSVATTLGKASKRALSTHLPYVGLLQFNFWCYT